MTKNLENPSYLKDHNAFASARGKLIEHGFPNDKIDDILADAFGSVNGSESEFEKVCKEISEQGKNHKLAKKYRD